MSLNVLANVVIHTFSFRFRQIFYAVTFWNYLSCKPLIFGWTVWLKLWHSSYFTKFRQPYNLQCLRNLDVRKIVFTQRIDYSNIWALSLTLKNYFSNNTIKGQRKGRKYNFSIINYCAPGSTKLIFHKKKWSSLCDVVIHYKAIIVTLFIIITIDGSIFCYVLF